MYNPELTTIYNSEPTITYDPELTTIYNLNPMKKIKQKRKSVRRIAL